jgi:hypothetical protein
MMASRFLICPACGRQGATLSHVFTLGRLRVYAACVHPLCGRTWKVYGVTMVSKGKVLLDG